MTGQEIAAIAIAVAAAAWLVVHWRRRGLAADDHGERGCSGCAERPDPGRELKRP